MDTNLVWADYVCEKRKMNLVTCFMALSAPKCNLKPLVELIVE